MCAIMRRGPIRGHGDRPDLATTLIAILAMLYLAAHVGAWAGNHKAAISASSGPYLKEDVLIAGVDPPDRAGRCNVRPDRGASNHCGFPRTFSCRWSR